MPKVVSVELPDHLYSQMEEARKYVQDADDYRGGKSINQFIRRMIIMYVEDILKEKHTSKASP